MYFQASMPPLTICKTASCAVLRSFVSSILFLQVYSLSAQTLITTVAGKAGSAGFSGDGGPAISANLNAPVGICFDPAGNLYIADFNNQRVRKVDATTGLISTIAGNGTPGFSGDGGLALNAQLNHPSRLYADKNNHLFVVDYDNWRVRKIDLGTGIITTVAGNGTENNVEGGLAVNSGMLPNAITMDKAGNLIISQHNPPLANFTGNIISRLDMSTGIITTIAGTGMFTFSGDGGLAVNASLYNPAGLSFDVAGNLYFVDESNYRIRKIDAVTGIITTVAGNGGGNFMSPDGSLALNISFKNPTDVLVDGNGKLIIVDQNDERVRTVDLSTGIITSIAGNGYVGTGPDCVSPTSETMNDCTVAAVDATGSVYFSEIVAQRIRKVFASGNMTAQITISASGSPVCAGDPLTISAGVTGIGPFFYQWKVNGQNAGGNAPALNGSSLRDGDIVTCDLVSGSNGTCTLAGIVTSNSLTVRILPVLTPAVSISTPSATVCTGSSVTFTAKAANAGANPGYQWTVNGNSVGTNSNIYTAATGLQDNDIVECFLTVDPAALCTVTAGAVSTPLTIKVSTMTAPSIQINASAGTICPGDSVVFSAMVQNAGSTPSYQWFLNGIKVGGGGNSYGNAHLQDGDVVSCALTAGNAACVTSQPVLSNQAVISVRQVPAIRLAFSDTTITPGRQVILQAEINGNVSSWQWSPADDLSDPFSMTPRTIPMVSTTTFRLTAWSPGNCPVYKDVLVRVFYKLAMPNSFTPNGDGKNDVFRIPPFVTLELEEFSVFDRWGSLVFSTKNSGTGWNGTRDGQACAAGTYVYQIRGKAGPETVLSTGTVLLIR